MLSREAALVEIEALSRDALMRIVGESGLAVADISLIARSRGAQEQYDADDGAIIAGDEQHESTIELRSGTRGSSARRQLAQLWAVLAAVHASLVGGTKMTQRELWYRLKTTGLFASPQQVNDRVLDACAAISHRCGSPCPREALGVTAAPRGSMTGSVTLLPPVAPGADSAAPPPPQPLDASVYQVPGDTEAVRALRFGSDSRARCVLVVEKDSIFRRLIDDRFTERVPCVLITACGYPDLATRALVRAVVDALGVCAYALTDHNPHGLALMLAYKFGTAAHALERNACCPSLHWLGLRAADVRPGGLAYDGDGDDDALPADAFQPYTARDRSLLQGLRQRPCASHARTREDGH